MFFYASCILEVKLLLSENECNFFLFVTQEKLLFRISSYFIYKGSEAYLDFLKLRAALLGLKYWTEGKKFINPVTDSRKERASVGAVTGKINDREQNPNQTALLGQGRREASRATKHGAGVEFQIS